MLSARSVALAGIFALVGTFGLCSSSAQAAPPSAESALDLKPVQRDVPYQTPAADDVAKCKVVIVKNDLGSGWAVEMADGTRLRQFLDTDGDNKVDLWCYYNQGFEVYRDVDADHNSKADQYRWLGTAGTRWALDDNEDGKIDRWRQISAEEVTAEVIAAIATNDTERFSRLLATGEDLKAAGLGKSMVERLGKKIAGSPDAFAAILKTNKSVSPAARWVQFASSTPGIVPEGTDGASKDIRVYENAVAMFDDAGQGGQVLVGTIIAVGDRWRLVDAPQIVAENQPMAYYPGVFFSSNVSAGALAMSRNPVAGEAQDLVGNLEAIDRELATAKTPEAKADLNRRRVDEVEKLIATSSDKNERDTWMRQLVDTATVAIQNGSYPDGVERLQKFSEELGESDATLQAYVEYQIINTEYMRRQTPDADFGKVQEWYLTAMTAFVDKYPESPESATALLQLALSKEFEEKTDAAIEFYKRVAVDYPGTDASEKATGAVRRLQSVGRSIELRGRSIKGEAFDLAKLSGRPVIIHYWATWCDVCKQDMKVIRQLQAKYQSAGLQVVGVNVDATRDDAVAYLKENAAPWIHLFEDGGLESSGLAKQLGVQTLPMMILVDSAGKVVSNNIYAASLDAELARIAKPIAKPSAKK